MVTHTFLIPSKQHGSALIVALSILLVLTVLGVSALGTSSLQEKMAGNNRDSQVAFEAAEEALRSAEQFIDGLATTGSFNASGTGGLFSPKGTNPDAYSVESNWSSAVNASTTADVARLPQYMIQRIDAQTAIETPNASNNSYNEDDGEGKLEVFQITVRGYGVSPNSRVMLQSFYSKIF